MDKIKFAKLVSYVQYLMCNSGMLEAYHIEEIAELTKTDVSQNIADCNMVNALMTALRNNKRIEAIKQYRLMTGVGLQESKDAVDMFYFNVAPAMPTAIDESNPG